MLKKILALKNHLFQREILPRLSKARNKPSTVHISITYKCNLSCRMCDLWRTRVPEIGTSEWKRVIKELRDMLGPYTLKIAGGEPLSRPDTVDILKYAHSLGIYTGLSTNSSLISHAKAEELIDAGLNEIHISLDSVSPESHDYTRNASGAFQMATQAIMHLKELKEIKKSAITINLASIINRRNISELGLIVDFVKSNKLHSVVFQPIMQNFGEAYDPAWFRKSPLWPEDLDKVDKAIDGLIAIRAASHIVGNKPSQLEAFKQYFRNPLSKAAKNCQAGVNEIAFNPDGSMLLCYNLPPIGNIADGGLQKILWSPEAERRRRDISACQRNCNLLNCNYEK